MKDENPNTRTNGRSGPADAAREDGGYAVPDHAVPDHPVLDRSGAMRRLELDPESYDQLLALMTVEVAGALDALAEAWRRGDTVAVRLHAHRLKSEAANVGAEEVRFAASRLEWLLRREEEPDGEEDGQVRPGDASAAVSHLRTALARLAAVLGQ
ncbi:Hpt domain-containing protein [Nitratidesulfovibrio sp. D1]|uniref:Hpt domain-containing protein n=1 Tax=Nitratidesulfovibrio sp. D1 TaxID=3440151 RepID=UPI003EBD38E6